MARENISSPPIFQSTPPCGGDSQSLCSASSSWISIHAPLRGRQKCHSFGHGAYVISIHAPLRGRPFSSIILTRRIEFQSTPPCGGDEYRQAIEQELNNFNPRPLAGATPCVSDRWEHLGDFNPRPLAGTTSWMPRATLKLTISIHAPLRGRRTSTVAC